MIIPLLSGDVIVKGCGTGKYSSSCAILSHSRLRCNLHSVHSAAITDQSISLWRHGMEMILALLSLCEVISTSTGGFPTQRASNAELWCCLCCQTKQAVETPDLAIILDAKKLIWHHCSWQYPPFGPCSHSWYYQCSPSLTSTISYWSLKSPSLCVTIPCGSCPVDKHNTLVLTLIKYSWDYIDYTPRLDWSQHR